MESTAQQSPEIASYLQNIHLLSSHQQREVLALLDKIEQTTEQQKARTEFLPFVRKMWPGFIEGAHHKVMADAFERVAQGKLKRLVVNLAPRMSKSEMASYLLPAWFMGKYPGKKIIQASHTADLAVSFGRKVRNLIGSDEFQKVFPGVNLAADNKAAGRWNTNRGGTYYAIGVGGAVSGIGADLCILDDANSEQEAKLALHKPEIFDQTYEWYTSGPRQRLQPNGSLVIVATRWGKRDLCGQVLKAAGWTPENNGLDGQWEVIELPAILPSGNALWPEFWPLDQLLAIKADIPLAKWNAQYQQTPTAEEGAIVKREWWKVWQSNDPPENIEFIIQTWDTAFTQKTNANYSACTTWGIFQREFDEGGKTLTQSNIILLDAFRKRMDFPELKSEALRQYKYWKPDAFIVEAKASGQPLIFELRQMGIPVSDFTPVRGSKSAPNDKIARLNGVSDIFRSGLVWAPDRKWAEEVVEEVASFPAGDYDDLVDSTVLALARYRQGGFLRLDNDEDEADREQFPHRRKRSYY
jgi:predicted phage terminase large subunit-like protein